MQNQQRILTVSEVLTLNTNDQLILQQFNALNTIKNSDFNNFIAEYFIPKNIELLIRLALNDADFLAFCDTAIVKLFFYQQSETFGVWQLQIFYPDLKFFYPHPIEAVSPFKIIIGRYFFIQSLFISSLLKNHFSEIEIDFLKKSIEFNSIHAIQHYNQYLYQKIDQDSRNASAYYREIIKNINKNTLTDLYGSYTYCLLAEAYFLYAQFLHTQNQCEQSQQFLALATQAVHHANQILEPSQQSIYNASLGQGLKVSNRWKLDHPLAILNKLQEGNKTIKIKQRLKLAWLKLIQLIKSIF